MVALAELSVGRPPNLVGLVHRLFSVSYCYDIAMQPSRVVINQGLQTSVDSVVEEGKTTEAERKERNEGDRVLAKLLQNPGQKSWLQSLLTMERFVSRKQRSAATDT